MKYLNLIRKRKSILVIAFLGIILVTGCEDYSTNDPIIIEQPEELNTPDINWNIEELLEEPKRGLKLKIHYRDIADGVEIQRKLYPHFDEHGTDFLSIGKLGSSNAKEYFTYFEDWDITIGRRYGYRARTYKGNIYSEWSEEMTQSAPGIQTKELPYVTVTDDAYISESDPNANYGDEYDIFITRDSRQDIAGDQQTYGYMKWPLDHIPEYAIGISNAELRFLTLNAASLPPAAPNGYLVSNHWDESSITWNNKPSEYVGAIFMIQVIHNDGQPYFFDITPAVEDWVIDGVENNGIVLRIKGPSEGGVTIVSKEFNYEAYTPRLTITYEW
jgi:hypothetical protein